MLGHALRPVADAGDESEKERSSRSRLTYGISPPLVVVSGVAVLVVIAGRYPQLMAKGRELAAKVGAKAIQS